MNLKQLSDQLSLSQTTVSRALNGYPEVSEATRLRVQDAARRFNYSPSSQAKGLATGKALAIGHVISTKSKHEMVNPIFGDFIAGAGEVYARRGYEMILSMVDENSDEASVYRSLEARRAVDGVVVHGPLMEDPRIPLLHDLGLPFIVHGRASGITAPYTWLDVNNTHAFERATNFLLDLGHRRIAMLNGLEGMDFAYRRRKGFETSMKERGAEIDADIMYSEEMTEHFGYSTTLKLLDRSQRPTAVIASSMLIALGVRRAIEERGLVMGRDMSVVTHDDALSYLQNGGDVPIFTATRSSVRDAGRQVGEMLLNKIENPGAAESNRLLEAQLTVGQSTGPVPT